MGIQPPWPSLVEWGTTAYSLVVDQGALDLVKNQESALGHTHHTFQQITISPHQAEDCLSDTVLHELLHVAWTLAALGETKMNKYEELVVANLSPWLLTMIRQNPELIRRLAGKWWPK